MVAGMMSFVACGPTAEELAKIAADSARVADSIALFKADSAAAVAAAEQQIADSTARAERDAFVADSIANAKPVKKVKK